MTQPPARETSSALASGLYIAGSLLVLVIFLVNPGINHYPPSLFDKTVDGTAHKPYVLRALVPVTIRVVAAVVPASVRSSLTAAAKTSPLREVLTTLDKIPPELCTEFLIALLIMLGALLGFLLALRDLFETLFEAPREFVWKVARGGGSFANDRRGVTGAGERRRSSHRGARLPRLRRTAAARGAQLAGPYVHAGSGIPAGRGAFRPSAKSSDTCHPVTGAALDAVRFRDQRAQARKFA